MINWVTARPPCAPSDGHDVGPVDVFRLVLHARLDAADQRLDLVAAQGIVDVNPGDEAIAGPGRRR